jgi:hypothetical protein
MPDLRAAFAARLELPPRGADGRWRASFTPERAMFSPGRPVPPADPQPLRTLDFGVGINTTSTPRAAAPFSFAELRRFANVELVRLAIETVKDQVERLDWRIQPRAGGFADPGDVAALERFFARPDGVTPFPTWLRALLEDLLVLDAPAAEKRRDRSGRLVGLDVAPGDTFKLLVDDTGRRPRPPLPAYQQVIKGVVWADLTAADLLYAPRNPRPNHLYGFSPVEQIVVTLQTALHRQTAQLGYFTEGNVPSGLLNAPSDWGPDAIRTLQEAWDARLAGDAGAKSRIFWAPAEAKYQAFKDSPLKDDFDEWLARIVTYAFGLPPTPFVRQMNRSTATSDDQRSQAEGVEPRKLWWKRIADQLLAEEFGRADLEWRWQEAGDVDPLVQAQIDDLALRNGSATVDEVRARRGLGPLPDGQTARIYTATGADPL